MSATWRSPAVWFLAAGLALALVGLVLWLLLPMRLALPPFFFTALISSGYGGGRLLRERRRSSRP